MDMGTINTKQGPYFEDDLFFANKALASSSSIESPVFALGGTQSSTKIQIFGKSVATLAAGQTIKVELMGCDTENGEYKAYQTQTLTGAMSSGTKFVADAIVPMVEFIPAPDAPAYGKVKITTDSDMAELKVDGKIGYIPR